LHFAAFRGKLYFRPASSQRRTIALAEKQKPESRFGIRVVPAVAGVIAGVVAPATAHGGLLLSNLGDPEIEFGRSDPLVGSPIAQAFLTGPQTATVFSIIIDLPADKRDTRGTYTASLYTDLSGNPNIDLGDSAPISDTVGDLDFLFASPVPLAANTMYWVVASNSANCGPVCSHWAATDSLAQTSDSGATFQGDLKFFNGSSWVNTSSQSPSVGLMSIDAPEPGGFSLAALGGALIAWITRLRKRSRST
jgi:hypothetical protein